MPNTCTPGRKITYNYMSVYYFIFSTQMFQFGISKTRRFSDTRVHVSHNTGLKEGSDEENKAVEVENGGKEAKIRDILLMS